MGAVTFSIDLQLVKALKQALPLNYFVETGTFEGDSVEQVKPLFEVIHSIELAEEYYTKAVERFQATPHVQIHLGRSEEELRSLQPVLADQSVLYWLDAHWCLANQTAGQMSQCPLLQELDAICQLNSRSVILIDDARLFLCPPPHPHEISQWPNFDALLRKLYLLSPIHEVMVLNDVILFYPASIQSTVRQYAHQTSVDWLSVLDKSRDYNTLLNQLQEKDRHLQEKESQIRLLAGIAQEREADINAKQDQINLLAEEINQLRGHLEHLQEKEAQIQRLARIAQERETDILEKQAVIQKLTGELNQLQAGLNGNL
jgi:DNA repair exonuclease SbcCD ATPase subunit